jgi:hypothetical protein
MVICRPPSSAPRASASKGNAKADAEKALQLAPVAAQIELAREIGSNEGYQAYLVSLRGVEAYVEVGVEQAKAIAQADVKVIANAGDAVQGRARCDEFDLAARRHSHRRHARSFEKHTRRRGAARAYPAP